MEDNNTFQQLERTESGGTWETTATSPKQWRAQFDRQFTNATVERVLKQTIALIAEVEAVTPWRDQLGPDDRINAAVLKLLEGSRRWDPERVELAWFLIGVITSDVSHELERLTKHKQLSLDNDGLDLDGLEQETSEAIEDERSAKCEVPREVWWSQFMLSMRLLASDDLRVLAILSAYEEGKCERRAVIQHTGLSAKQHDAAYRRLQVLAEQIDDQLRELVHAAIV